ncbi:MAG: class I SAM-dependent methyltransferase [Gemmatimonadaceae bacterium]|jgi:SAM-dependent methyltransferase|nr:class I SAM-dependent methyltransferase [Gemmatimonadaceae bacterium]
MTAAARRRFLSILEALRHDEIRGMLPLLGSGGRVLEIGAGSGWQARELASQGFTVEAIDVASSEYRASRVWPVIEYDGLRIPFPDASFDVVFSSNVLEHIPHVEAFQGEILRVLRPGGIAVHAMPSFSWRLWTTLAHYPWIVRQFAKRLAGDRTGLRAGPTEDATALSTSAPATRPSKLRRAAAMLGAPRHGETGTMIGELWLFSRPRWRGLFERAGFHAIATRPLGLLYSGYLVFGDLLSVAARRRLASLLGSSCIAYSMRKAT